MRRAYLVELVFAGILALGAGVQCGREGCTPGDRCECSNGSSCYLGCDGDGCDQSCHNAEHCGNVCDNGCNFVCHDSNDCSSFCGKNCGVECHNMPQCGAICGANCNYDCHDVDRCGAQVGPNSTVRCSNASSCVVACDGACHVFCNQVGGPCTVTCAEGLPGMTCPDGSTACGPC